MTTPSIGLPMLCWNRTSEAQVEFDQNARLFFGGGMAAEELHAAGLQCLDAGVLVDGVPVAHIVGGIRLGGLLTASRQYPSSPWRHASLGRYRLTRERMSALHAIKGSRC
jgi:hypothetical protein